MIPKPWNPASRAFKPKLSSGRTCHGAFSISAPGPWTNITCARFGVAGTGACEPRSRPMQKERSEVNTQEKSLESMSRQEVEDFLYTEGDLLDHWKLDEWLTLYTADAQYLIPTNDLRSGDPENDLVYINHDFERLQPLVLRLNNSRAHREYPCATTTHLVTNGPL